MLGCQGVRDYGFTHSFRVGGLSCLSCSGLRAVGLWLLANLPIFLGLLRVNVRDYLGNRNPKG